MTPLRLSPTDRTALADELVSLVRAAGAAVMAVYRRPITVELKADASPLTEADLSSHRTLVAGLDALSIRLPVVSEESDVPPFEQRRAWPAYWLIDPLDGTAEFIDRNGEFTVNVALVEAGRPTLGCVGVPARGQTLLGDTQQRIAMRYDGTDARPILARRYAGDGPTVVASRRRGNERLDRALAALEHVCGPIERRPVGSALKLCLLAEGEADLYPRFGPTSEWDIAAAHAVLDAAGGAVLGLDGTPLVYNKPSIINPEFVAMADPSIDWLQRLAVAD